MSTLSYQLNILTKAKRLFLILFMLNFVVACIDEKPKEIKTTPKPIAWIKAEANNLSQVRRVSGTLQAAQKADLSFEVSGKVKVVKAKLGDSVKKNQVLAELDQSSYELTRQSANGRLQEAQAKLKETDNEFKRQSNLFKKGWVSKAALENATAALETAKSALKVAKAQLALTKEDLGDTSLRAPYEGKIVARKVEPSQTVNAGQTVLQIEGLGALEISVLVPETMISYLSHGQVYDTIFPALPKLTIESKVTEIGSRTKSANAFPVTLLLEQQNKDLLGGMTAEVDFTFDANNQSNINQQAVRIPPTAILAGDNQKTYVFVYNPELKNVQKREVTTVNVINNDILVSSGIKAGDIIATIGVEYLYDQQAVRLLGVGTKLFN